MKLEITITGDVYAPPPGLPALPFPGVVRSGAAFRVTAGAVPARLVLAELLLSAVVDAYVTDYDEKTGEGYFVVVDGDAPALGEVVDLYVGYGDSDTGNNRADPYEPDAYASMSIERFYDVLNHHEWYSGFADNYSLVTEGEADLARLQAIATLRGGDHLALYEAFWMHYFSGKPWNTPRWEKPGRPVNGVLILPGAPPSLAPEGTADIDTAEGGDRLATFLAFLDTDVSEAKQEPARPSAEHPIERHTHGGLKVQDSNQSIGSAFSDFFDEITKGNLLLKVLLILLAFAVLFGLTGLVFGLWHLW